MGFFRMKSALIILLLFISLTLLSVPVCAEDHEIIDLKNGYIVTPAYGINTSEREVVETRQVDFWETSPYMIISCITDEVPIFGEAIVIILFSFLFSGISLFGLKHISKNTALINENRIQIYNLIEEKPGINYSEILEKLDIKKSTLKYHIKKLISYDIILLHSENGRSGYFRNSDTYTVTEMNFLLANKNSKDREILEILNSNPEITRTEITDKTGLSGPSVTWHMKRLEKYGLIDILKNGRKTGYKIKYDPESMDQKEA